MRVINPGCYTPRGAVRLREFYGPDGMFAGWTFAFPGDPLEPYGYGWISPDGSRTAEKAHKTRKDAEKDLLEFSCVI